MWGVNMRRIYKKTSACSSSGKASPWPFQKFAKVFEWSSYTGSMRLGLQLSFANLILVLGWTHKMLRPSGT